jgi:predicted ATPase
MVENVTGGKLLPDKVLEQIIEKTDGVPLFVEELTKTILESGLLSEKHNRYVVTGSLTDMAIPTTLHDSLMARLDRLGTVKEVAQTAAVIGREFDYDLLAIVSTLSFEKLRDAVNQLIDAELIFRRGRSQGTSCIFKHALIQDAAYQSLLKSKRHQLHARVAKALEERFSERTETEPELLAHHLTEADDIERAIGFWIKAGDRDIQRSASAEAVSHFRTALALVERLPHTDQRDEVELSIQAPLGAALTATLGYTAAETKAAYTRAYALCQKIGRTDQICHVMYGIWNYLFVGTESAEALELAEEGLRMAEDKQERLPHLVAHDWMGVTCFTLGRLEDAQAHLENALSLYDADEHRTLVYQCGEDPRYESANWLGLTSWVLGYPERAKQCAKDAVAWAEELSYAPSIAYTLYFQVWVDLFRRDWQNVTKRTQELISFCTEQSIAHFRALGMVHHGAALIEQGDIRSGLESIEEGWRIWGSNRLVTTFHWLSANGHWQLGDSETAMQLLDDASALVTRTDERFWEAEIHRLRGEIHRSRGPDFFQLGESCFDQALSVAQAQEAKSLELRAATSLARLWQELGKRDKALALLAGTYNWFTEGFDTPDLKEAKTLLDELS